MHSGALHFPLYLKLQYICIAIVIKQKYAYSKLF